MPPPPAAGAAKPGEAAAEGKAEEEPGALKEAVPKVGAALKGPAPPKEGAAPGDPKVEAPPKARDVPEKPGEVKGGGGLLKLTAPLPAAAETPCPSAASTSLRMPCRKSLCSAYFGSPASFDSTAAPCFFADSSTWLSVAFEGSTRA